MTVKEFYEELGVDYNSVLKRLVKDTLILKLLKRYAADKNYQLLCDAVAEKDQKKAFDAAHTVKGVAMNLGFNDLGSAASVLTEAMRDGYADNAEELLEAVKKEQEKVAALIEKLD